MMPRPRARVVFEDPEDNAALVAAAGTAGKPPSKAPEPPDPEPDEPDGDEDDQGEPLNPGQEPLEREAPKDDPNRPVPAAAPSGPTSVLTYESRVHIVEAWQFHGRVAEAPLFVNRDWIAWVHYDDYRKLDPGPALRVPTPAGDRIARVGDYIVRQLTTLIDGLDPEEMVDVWWKEDFERLFIPRRRVAKAPEYVRPFSPAEPMPSHGAADATA